MGFTPWSAGNINVTLIASQANSNHDDGFDLGECGDGNFTLTATWTTADDNGQHGFEGLEQDSGDYVARLTAVRTSGNEHRGVFLIEEMDGNLDFRQPIPYPIQTPQPKATHCRNSTTAT
jgi:hypothetical protein